MKLILLCLVLFLALPAAENEIHWQGWSDGYAAVKKEKKPAIIDFYTEWCVWCKRMDASTFQDAKVKKMLGSDFIAMRINPEKSKEMIDYDNQKMEPGAFFSAIGGQGFPACAIFDADGKFLTLIPGYIEPNTFLLLLKYVKEEQYRNNVKLEDYISKNLPPKVPTK